MKKLIKIETKYFRLFQCGGYPKFRIIPSFYSIGYSKHWNMYGFFVSWLGQEFKFSFCEDKKGLYKIGR